MSEITPVQPAKNDRFRRGHWSVLNNWPLIIVLILIIASLSYFVGWSARGMVEAQKNSQSSQVPNPLNSPSNQENSNQLSDMNSWNVYTNGWPISFKYPSKKVGVDMELISGEDQVSLSIKPEWGMSFKRAKNTSVAAYSSEFLRQVINPQNVSDLGMQKLNGYDARVVVEKFDSGDIYNYFLQMRDDVIVITVEPEKVYGKEILATFQIEIQQAPIEGYQNKRYNQNDNFLGNLPYPTVLKNLTDEQLTPISCSLNYEDRSASPNQIDFKYTQGSADISLSDSELLTFIQSKNAELAQSGNGRKISIVSKCITQTGDSLIHYEIWAGGGGMGNTSYFSYQYKGKNGEISVVNDGIPYFGCQDPLTLTRTGTFYYGCGGGDGGYGAKSVYALNLTTATATRIVKCTMTSEPDLLGKNTETCE